MRRLLRALGIILLVILLLGVAGGVVLYIVGRRAEAGHNEAAIEIDRPVAQVFGHLVDPELLRRWHGWQKVTPADDFAPRVGARMRIITQVSDRRVELSGEITILEPNQRVALLLRSDDPSLAFMERRVVRVEERAGRSRVRVTTDATYFSCALGLMEPIITKTGRQRLEDDVARLKRRAELEPASMPAIAPPPSQPASAPAAAPTARPDQAPAAVPPAEARPAAPAPRAAAPGPAERPEKKGKARPGRRRR